MDAELTGAYPVVGVRLPRSCSSKPRLLGGREE
jgi:hypothetical protein